MTRGKRLTLQWREEHLEIHTQKARHLWKLRYQKSAGCCGGNQISKSRCRKHMKIVQCQTRPFIEVGMWTNAHGSGKKHNSKSKVTKSDGLRPFLDVQRYFYGAGAKDSVPVLKGAKREGLITASITLTGVVHVTKICTDACRVVGAVKRHVHQRC